jgi:hypothetical protein
MLLSPLSGGDVFYDETEITMLVDGSISALKDIYFACYYCRSPDIQRTKGECLQ